MTDRKTHKRRLEGAGYTCLNDLWVPTPEAERMKRLAEAHRAQVARIRGERMTMGRRPSTPAQPDPA